MKSDILKQTDLVERILGDLSKYGEIPNKGFLSGGAVANTIMNYIFSGEYPINDLDIFIEQPWDRPTPQSWTPLRTNSLVVEGDGYMVTKLSYDHGSNYHILSVERDGYLNNIYVSSVEKREDTIDYKYILNGFDFNCCQVGINLENNTLVYTESFVNFLNTQQLEVTAIYTPAHTAIRLFKKLDELKCYCNVDESMELLSQPLIMENIIHLSPRHFGFYFSTKYKEMYFKYYTKIKEYFKLTKYFDHKKSIWLERNNVKSNEENANHVVNWLNPNSVIPQSILEHWAKLNDVMWTLSPKKYGKTDDKVNKVLERISYNPLTFINAFNIVKGKTNKKLKSKAEKIILGDYFLCKVISLVDSGFYDCDFDDSHVKEIESFLDKERWLVKHITKNKINLQNSLSLIREVKKVYNNEGDWVSELVANFVTSANKFYKINYDSIVEGIKKEKEKYCVNLFEPIEFSDFVLPEGVKIKELITELDLQWGGKRLKNCMNNPGQDYKGKIQKGKVKVFVIMTQNNMSGLELHLLEDSVYKQIQLLSYCNKETSEYHKIIANMFVNYLNMSHLKKTYEQRINNFITIDLMNRGLLVSVKDEDTKNNTTSFGLGLALEDVHQYEEEVPRFRNENLNHNAIREEVLLEGVQRLGRLVNINGDDVEEPIIDPYEEEHGVDVYESEQDNSYDM